MIDVLVINGPNLNLLGSREIGFYGEKTMDDLTSTLGELANNSGVSLENFQSNHEGEIIDKIQNLNYRFLIVNLAAYTHTSIAIRDAILAVDAKFIEVHISNVYNREKFRHKSYFSDISVGLISGFGLDSYTIALNYAVEFLKKDKKKKKVE